MLLAEVTSFGVSPEFQLCGETADDCQFNARLDSMNSCNDVCQDAGSRCLGQWRNAAPNDCVMQNQVTCANSDAFDEICSCSRP